MSFIIDSQRPPRGLINSHFQLKLEQHPGNTMRVSGSGHCHSEEEDKRKKKTPKRNNLLTAFSDSKIDSSAIMECILQINQIISSCLAAFFRFIFSEKAWDANASESSFGCDEGEKFMVQNLFIWISLQSFRTYKIYVFILWERFCGVTEQVEFPFNEHWSSHRAVFLFKCPMSFYFSSSEQTFRRTFRSMYPCRLE